MIAVSEAWKNTQQRFLLPESFVEIDYDITDSDVQSNATVTGANEAVFSNVESILGTDAVVRYATNELNLWSLDGTYAISPTTTSYGNTGYVSNIEQTGSISLTFPEVHAKATSSVSIVWDSHSRQYPIVFTVSTKKGDAVLSTKTISDNASYESEVVLDAENFDGIIVSVLNWSMPNRRARLEKFSIRHQLTLRKSDILRYNHKQSGDLLCGELSKNSIEFTLDNSDGRWNPNNPDSMEQYLARRQRLSVRYGLDINGIVEWIKAGTFYLSEWTVPSNGLEAQFVARDIFEYLIDAPYEDQTIGTLKEIIQNAFLAANVPVGFQYELSPVLDQYSTSFSEKDGYTCAEIVQMCANIAACVVYQDRDGVLHIKEFDKPTPGFVFQYVIPTSLSYIHPEIELTKPLKNISISYGDDGVYSRNVSATGETQTVANPLVINRAPCEKMADEIVYMFKTRKSVSGEYRSDPRLDLFDVVAVQSKYGELSPVVIMGIDYSFNGSFRGTFKGKVVEYSEEG